MVSGSQPTLGDLAIYGALKGLAASTPTVIKLFNQVVNVGRWFAFIEAQPAVQAALGGADGTSSATSSSSGAVSGTRGGEEARQDRVAQLGRGGFGLVASRARRQL